ncbi:MAG: hypothetical protein ACLSVD_08545 [Eggerthellaceae bacterium]
MVRDAILDRAARAITRLRSGVHPVDGRAQRGCTLLKGGGSDTRAAWSCWFRCRQAGHRRRARTLRARGANACPPLVGVGIGSTFDKVGGEAGACACGRARPTTACARSKRSCRGRERHGHRTGGPGRPHDGTVCAWPRPCRIAALPGHQHGCSAMRRITVPLACQPAERLDAAASAVPDLRDAAGLRTEVRGACAIPRISGTAETLADFAEPASDRSRCARSARMRARRVLAR